MAKDRRTKIVSKKHLARLERERRQVRIITGIAIVVIVAVVAMIIYGVLGQTVLLSRSPIVKLGDQSVTTREFQLRVRIARQQLISQYFQYMQYAQMFGIQDPLNDPSFSQYFTQITTQLDTPTEIGNTVLSQLEENLFNRQYAKQNGINVTTEEVDKAIHEGFGYYPDGTPTSTLTPTEIVYPTLSATQLDLVPPTATETLIPSPTVESSATPTITPTLDLTQTPTLEPTTTATLLPSPAPTDTPTLIPTITLTPTITPTETPYTLVGFQAEYQRVFKDYKKLGMTESDFRLIFFEDRLYHDKIYAIITANTSHTQEQVWARHILVADETTAKTVLSLLAAGSKFNTLAATYSTDTGSKDKGGDLGWFGKGAMVAEFETAAFSLKVGEISQPVKSQYGYHIIQVLGHEIRPLTDAEYKTLTDNLYQDWLTKTKTAAGSDLKVFDYWTARIPNDPTIASVQSDLGTQAAQTQIALPTETPTPK